MKKRTIVFFLLTVLIMTSCEKFLDETTDKKLVLPSDLASLQALLDIYSTVNNVDPGEGEVASDDYYLSDEVWSAISSDVDRRAYTWEPNFSTRSTAGWFTAYRYIYYANVILKSLQDIERVESNQHKWDNVRGQAYFLRGRGFLALASIWSVAYDPLTASEDLGVPLRLDPDFNIQSRRSSNQETYSQIVSDLTKAAELLPMEPEHVLRASKPAAYAALARTFLFMREYEKCLEAANSCLSLKNELMDYNTVDAARSYPFPLFNIEVIHHSVIPPIRNPILNVNRALVDTALYHSYLDDDLRKKLFFRQNENGTVSMRGHYSGSGSPFSGIATNEVYLMRAECLVRQGNMDAGVADLNHILVHRYAKDSFKPVRANDRASLLDVILEERRKELLFRGLRFADVKRLNKEGANIGFKRILNEVEYSLEPNDLRFALSIPEEVIEQAPLIEQNRR